MKQLTVLSLMAALAVGACVTGTALAQEDTMPAQPRFTALKPNLHGGNTNAPVTPLTTWNGSFVYKNHTYKYNMVGNVAHDRSVDHDPGLHHPGQIVVCDFERHHRIQPADQTVERADRHSEHDCLAGVPKRD